MLDFSLKKYELLLQTFNSNNIAVYGIADWLKKKPSNGIVIRHDVDRLPGNALKMAKLESEYGIYTTYYFRIMNHTFKPTIIKEIREMGHEVGYHYEDLSLAKGDYGRAKQLFERHLNRFRENSIDVKTVAMHGRPFSNIDNRDFWKKNTLEDFGLSGEAFLTIDYSDIYYFTDTGRAWAANKNNIRDKITSKLHPKNIQNTDDLIRFVQEHPESKMAIVAHPERWNNYFIYWFLYYEFDTTVNLIKRILKKLYK